MPHHRYSTTVARPRTVHFKVSDDALVTILEYLDPASLWSACKAITRIRRLVRQTPSLRYRFELAIMCMKDGPVSLRRMPLYKRTQFLGLLQQHWAMTQASKEFSLSFNLPAIIGVSGRFVYEIQNHGLFNLLNLFELPSSTMNIVPSQLKPFQCPEIEHVAVDHVQNLIVSSHAYNLNGQISVKVHFRDIRTQSGHSQAFAPMYDLATQVAGKLIRLAANICGSRIIITLEFAGGRIQHLLMNWHHFQARWLRDTDLHFIEERTLLGTNRGADGVPYIALYDLPEVPKMGVKAQFMLPAEWNKQLVEFAHSASPKWDSRVSSNALVIPAPEWSMLVLTTKPKAGPGAGQKWCYVPESFFRFLPRRKITAIPWKDWSHVCRPITNISNHTYVFAGPNTVGSKVVYVDYYEKAKRLCVIDVSPFHPLEASIDTSKGQHDERHRKIGEFPETHRAISSRVEDLRVTEDNIVLVLNDAHHHAQQKIVQVLTLGMAPV